MAETRIIAHDPGRDVLPTETLGANQVGELLVRGPHCTAGYWNRPSESARLIRYGWLYTGDLFLRDAEGYHYFKGRVDDMIVSGGENIFPAEVEAILLRCPGVREAAVVGMPSKRWGQEVAAFVVREHPAPDEQAIDAFCLESNALARYKRPRQIVFVDALPRNPSGKVLTRKLSEQLEQAV